MLSTACPPLVGLQDGAGAGGSVATATKLPVLSLTDPSSPAGSITLDDELFGVEPRRDILHRVVVWQTYPTHSLTE